MLKTNSIATVGNRNKYGANREPQRVRLGVSNGLASAGDMVSGALIGLTPFHHSTTPPPHYSTTPFLCSTATPSRTRTSTIAKLTCSPPGFRDPALRFQYSADRPPLSA